MKANKFAYSVLFILICVLPTQVIYSQDICETLRGDFERDPLGMFENLISRQCLGSVNDLSDQMKEIRLAEDEAANDFSDEYFEDVSSLIKMYAVLTKVKSQIQSIDDFDIQGIEIKGNMLNAINYSITTIDSFLNEGNNEFLNKHRVTPAPLLSYSDWEPITQGSRYLYINLYPKIGFQEIKTYDSLIKPNCIPIDTKFESDECQNSLEVAEIVIRSANAISRSAASNVDEFIQRLSDNANTIDKRWDYYLNDSRTQTIFELYLNSKIWRNNTEKHPAGFRLPPSGQLILLHPSAGLDFLIRDNQEEMVKPALFLEIIGYNWWNYKNDGSAGFAKGASFLVTYTGRSTATDWGYGAIFHFQNRYSIALTRHGSDFGIMISADMWANRDKIRSFFQ